MRTSTLLVFQNGQCVYCERANLPKLKGLGIIIGKETRLLLDNFEFFSQITKESITQAPADRNQSIPEDPESNVLIKGSHTNDENDERTVEINVFEDDSDSTYEEEDMMSLMRIQGSTI